MTLPDSLPTFTTARLTLRSRTRLCKNRRPVFGRICEADVAAGSKSGRSQTPTRPLSRSARYLPSGLRACR